MKYILYTLFAILCVQQANAQSHWEFRIMPQAAFGGRNTVQRPNNEEGTRIFLSKDFNRKHKTSFSPRLELEYTYKRHHAVATAAFLTDRFEGTPTTDIWYNHVQFNSGIALDAVYRFNTYRLTYRYRLVDKNRFNFELGATLLLRDAFISLEDSNRKTSFKNVGVAPLLSYSIEWKATDRMSLLSYGDAFAIKVGRAEDIFVGARYQFNPRISGILGYRLLEGGSDADKVYTMAAFHYISVGLGVHF